MAGAISRGQYGGSGDGWQAFGTIFSFLGQINSCFSILRYQRPMLSDHTLRWIAPNSFIDWLRQRALVRDLRGLLHRLHLATPGDQDVHATMQTVINEIASAEEVERQAFRSILEIEAAYEAAKKDRRLRRAAAPQEDLAYPKQPAAQDNSVWLLLLLAFWRRKPNRA